MSEIPPVNTSITKQLFKMVFSLYCIIAIIVTVVQVITEYRYTQQSIQEELQSYQRIFGPVLAKALWDLDKEQVNDIINGLSQVPVIVGVKIERLQENKLIAYAGINSAKPEAVIDRSFSYQFPILYQLGNVSQPLGQATLYSNSSIVLNRIKLNFVFLLLNAFIKGLALAIIFWWASKLIIVMPLNRLIQAISRLRFSNLEVFSLDLKTNQDNELGSIERSFSTTVEELAEAKKSVLDFNQRLENKVQERTQELKSATLKAEASAQAKSEFLATMSHELRTPMNGIQGMLYLLKGTSIDNKQQQYVDIASQSATDLLSLINNILDLAKSDANKLELNIEEFDLNKLLEDVISLLSASIKNEALTLQLNNSSIDSGIVSGDPAKLKQVLLNLIGNAIKFSQQGQITVTAKLDKFHNDSEYRLTVSIKDSGCGISQKVLPKLFERFVQADSSSTRQHDGSGLGLAISKQLCELMQGNITVDSTLGEGSCFTFVITLLPAK